ncbi:hypothetical protein [Neoroseomonas lacus]|uniref:Uncharacterized protein n=1 Tax=Neoroseomonas lacus TaxID=287609 RepID=A0A917NYI6_9PROT|nr:hypothetical protein [Neoroseomonas lacus]GGJ40943.1 hypothetical protein GCM10011320_55740 [Neoroseomonas lacus]
MTRFFDSHAWNVRNRDAAAAVLRAFGLDRAGGSGPGYLSAEVADVTVRAGCPTGLAASQGGSAVDPSWLGGGDVPQPAAPGPESA